MRKQWGIVSLIVPVLFFLILPQAHAQKAGSLTVDPAFTEVVLEKEAEKKTIEITYSNTSDKEITLELFPLDFKQQGEFGEVSFLGQDASTYSYSLASFLSLETDFVTIPPGEKKVFTVTVQNRESLSPGGHYAAVVARLQTEQKDSTTSLAPSVSSLILLRKSGGERFNLSLIDTSWPKNFSVSYPSTTRFLFQNEGNIHVVPYGTIRVKDIFGRELYKGIVNPSSLRVMPETRRYVPVVVEKQRGSFPISVNEVVVEGRDSIDKLTYNYRGSFIYVHPAVLFGTVLLPFVFVFLFFRRLKKRITRT